MQLTRDKIQRMIGATAGGSVSYSGGGGGGTMMAGVTPAYYNQNFTLMYKTVVVVTDGDEVISTTTTFATAAPNEIVNVGTTSETDSQTGYVTTTTVSLVGPQAQNALVIGDLILTYDSANNAIKVVNRDGTTSANFYATGGVSALGYSGSGGGGGGATTLDGLDDVVIDSSTLTSGQVLKYDGTNWVNGAAPATGLTRISMTVPTGFAVSPKTMTQNGTFSISFASGYSLPTNAKQSNWDAAYGWGNHANAGYLTSSALSGYATQTWVENKGYLTSSSLSGYATQTWVSSNYLGINGTAAAATKLATAVYLWGNSFDGTSSIGTSTSSKSLSYVDSISMTGAITGVGYIFQHGNYILMNSGTNDYGLMIEGQGYNLGAGVAKATFGFHTASIYNNVSWHNNNIVMQLYQDTNDIRLEVNKIRIGGANGIDIAYESGSNALKIVRSDGVSETAANLYATGGLSALGFSAGTSSMDSFAFNYLTVNSLLNAKGNVQLRENYCVFSKYVQLLPSSSEQNYPLTLFYATKTSQIYGYTYYYNEYYNIGLTGLNESADETWWIEPDGCARFKRLYLDGTRYLYLSGSTLRYYNGSSHITIA